MLIGLTLACLPSYSIRAQGAPCIDTSSSRLKRGQPAQVVPNAPGHLLAMPTLDGRLLAQVSAGAFVDVLDGPTCADNRVWWNVAYGDLTGWMVEADPSYALDPAQYFEVAGVKIAVPRTFEPVVIEVIQGTNGPVSDFQLEFPTYVAFGLKADGGEILGYQRVTVYPLAAFRRHFDARAASEIVRLQDMLNRRPALPDLTLDASGNSNLLPYVEHTNAAQMFTAHAQYVQLGTITGISYVTWFAQNTVPVRNPLIYVFQGITTDGAYYVSLTMRVTLSTLPALAKEVQFDLPAFQKYMAGIVPGISAAPSIAYTPRPERLEGIVASVRIAPSALLKDDAATPDSVGK